MEVLFALLIIETILCFVLHQNGKKLNKQIENLDRELTKAKRETSEAKEKLNTFTQNLEVERDNILSEAQRKINKIAKRSIDCDPLLEPSFQRQYGGIQEYAGSNIINYPLTYISIDVETTGLYPLSDRVIEVSAVKINQGEIVDTFTSFVNPHRQLPEHIVKITGICDNDLASAPDETDIIPQLLKFIGKEIVLGHNVTFDIDFLHNSAARCGYNFSPDFVDTLILARDLLPSLSSKKLSAVCRALHVDPGQSHRSLDDAIAAHNCYLYLRRFALDTYINGAFRAKDYPPNPDADKNNPLCGKIVVFSGELISMSRCDATKLVADFGGKPREKVRKSTNYIVRGDLGNIRGIDWSGKSAKVKEAERLNAEEGGEIEIISESEFLKMVGKEITN